MYVKHLYYVCNSFSNTLYMSNNKKYGEETKMVCFRVPESKENEIKQLVKLKLNEYEKSALTSNLKDVSEEIPKWKQEAEKKSNPADDVLVKAEAEQKKYDNLETIKEISSRVKVVDKKVDMDALRKIASGEGLKGEFQLTKKKVDIDEEYEFEYVKSIPGINDAIYLDKKGLACYDKDDLGVFYVKWEAKYMRFENKAEFDRFAKEYLTLI